MFKSIQWKILALFIILTIIVMSFVAIFTASGTKKYYHEQFAVDMSESVFTESMTKQLNTASQGSFSELCDLLGKFSVRIGIDSYRLSILCGSSGTPTPTDYFDVGIDPYIVKLKLIIDS